MSGHMRPCSTDLDATGLRVGLVASRFHATIVDTLIESVRTTLLRLGASEGDISLQWVAGAFELPLVARTLADTGDVDAVVCLGCVVRGETAHFDYVAGEAASGIMRVGLDTGVPTIFGVLTTDTLSQAEERADTKGSDWAEAAVEIVRLLESVRG